VGMCVYECMRGYMYVRGFVLKCVHECSSVHTFHGPICRGDLCITFEICGLCQARAHGPISDPRSACSSSQTHVPLPCVAGNLTYINVRLCSL